MRTIYISVVCLIFTTQLFSQVIDTQFGDNGKINTLVETGYKFTFGSLYVQANNKIVAFQSKRPDDGYLQTGLYITRYNAGGITDNQFGNNGAVEIRHLLDIPETEWLYGVKILQQPDKKLLAVLRIGDQNSAAVYNTVLRLNANGSIDSSYGIKGVFRLDVGEIVTIKDADLQGSKLILGGFQGSMFYSSDYNVLTRITEQGNIDAGFGKNGVLKTLFWKYSNRETIRALVVDKLTQSIFCTGETFEEYVDDGYAYMAKCTPNGQIDPSFPTVYGKPGIHPYYTWPYGIDISPDHQFICFAATAIGQNGTYDRDYVWQVRMDGKVDSSFGLNGRAEISWRVIFNTMRFSEDKRLYFSGQGEHDFDDAAVTGRMNPKGHKDMAYGEDGVTELFDEDYTYSNNFDFHKRPGSNKGLVLSVITPHGSFIIRYHEALQTKLNGNDFSAAVVTKEPKVFTIYPNPVQSKLYVRINTATQKEIQINITDISGKKLRTEKIAANSTLTTHAINVSRLPAGVYLVNIVIENGVSTNKFVKE